MTDLHDLLDAVLVIHREIRQEVVAACEEKALHELSSIAVEGEGDTIYAIDRVSEELLLRLVREYIAAYVPVILIAEGLPGGQIVLPEGTDAADASWRVIVDPIDGTRGLMYQKRSAWILTGIAPNNGRATSLQDIQLAVQTEIPLVKQHLSDQVWAIRGKGVSAVRYNRLTDEELPLRLTPSNSNTIAHGFATISRFFPGARDELAAIDEEIILTILGPVQEGKAHCFEDQYICSGGQFYELIAGHDRFVADIRPLLETILQARGLSLGICCHPYDVCTELIARELGVIITDEVGKPLDSRLSVEGDISWVGYANRRIREQVEPALQQALKNRNLI